MIRAVTIKIYVIRNRIHCDLVETYRLFRGIFCLHFRGKRVNHALKVKPSVTRVLNLCAEDRAEYSSEMSVNYYQTSFGRIRQASNIDNPDMFDGDFPVLFRR